MSHMWLGYFKSTFCFKNSLDEPVIKNDPENDLEKKTKMNLGRKWPYFKNWKNENFKVGQNAETEKLACKKLEECLSKPVLFSAEFSNSRSDWLSNPAF